MNKRDLEKFREEMEREAMSSTRMLGSVLVLGIVILVTIFLCASCTTPQPTEESVYWKTVYVDKAQLRGTPPERLNEMWTGLYIEAMMNTLYGEESTETKPSRGY